MNCIQFGTHIVVKTPKDIEVRDVREPHRLYTMGEGLTKFAEEQLKRHQVIDPESIRTQYLNGPEFHEEGAEIYHVFTPVEPTSSKAKQNAEVSSLEVVMREFGPIFKPEEPTSPTGKPDISLLRARLELSQARDTVNEYSEKPYPDRITLDFRA